jgi:hypothetical protein
MAPIGQTSQIHSRLSARSPISGPPSASWPHNARGAARLRL